jgi:acetyl esterase/lipase
MIELWKPGQIPHFNPSLSPEIPGLFPYLLPGAGPHGVVIVCPGGGYNGRADHEGEPIARWLNSAGLSAFVMQYRVKPNQHPVPMLDLQRAIRYIRSHAVEFQIDPNRIGILGFSAGGHLVSTAATHFDPGDPGAPDPVDHASCRPDAAVLCYPVITFGPFRHDGSRTSLLGENPSQDLIDKLSNETQVTRQTPPCFLFHTAADQAVMVENSLLFASALSAHQVPFELHVFPNGPHGVGLALDDPVLSAWPRLCAAWFRAIGFITG